MQFLRRVGPGIWVCKLLALLFITWSVGLARNVKRTKEQISERAESIRLALPLEDAVRRLEAGILAVEPGPGAPAASWPDLLLDYRARHVAIPWASAGLQDFAARIDSLVQRLDTLQAKIASAPEAAGTSPQEREFRRLLNAAAAQAEAAVAALQLQVQTLSDAMDAKWSQLCFLVAVSGLLSLTVVGLMLGLTRSAWKQASMRTALQEHEERLRLVLEQLPAILWTTDRSLRITSSLGRGLAALGLRPDEVVGKSLYEFFGTDDATFLPIARHLGVLAGDTAAYELQWQGNIYENRVVPLYSASGEVMGCVGVAHDMTARRQAELKLRSLAAETSLAAERERRRLAAELHDRVIQVLGLTRIKLGSLRGGSPAAEYDTTVESLCALVEGAIQDARAFVFELSPPLLHDLGFGPAVEWLAEKLRVQHGIHCDVQVDGIGASMDHDLRIVLFQALRELLLNVCKHARATNVYVRLNQDARRVRVDVEDDGVGFDSTSLRETDATVGFGLFSIRESLHLMGGFMEFESSPGRGTRVRIEVPWRSGGDRLEDENSHRRRPQDSPGGITSPLGQ